MIILSGQTKGGVGKSLIAANLTVCLARAGRKVLLIDADRQKTSQKWSSMRVMNSVDPEIVCAALYAEDLDAAEAFYGALLGMERIQRVGNRREHIQRRTSMQHDAVVNAGALEVVLRH